MNRYGIAILLVAAFVGFVAANKHGLEFEEDFEIDTQSGDETHDDDLIFAGHEANHGHQTNNGLHGHHGGNIGFPGHHGHHCRRYGHRGCKFGHNGGRFGHNGGRFGHRGGKHGYQGGDFGGFGHGPVVTGHGGDFRGFGHGPVVTGHGGEFGHRGGKFGHNGGKFGHRGGKFGNHGRRSGHQGGFKAGGGKVGGIGAIGGLAAFDARERDESIKSGVVADNRQTGVGELDLDVADIQKQSKHTHFNKGNSVVSNTESGGEDLENVHIQAGHLDGVGALSNRNRFAAGTEAGRHESDTKAGAGAAAIGAFGGEAGGVEF